MWYAFVSRGRTDELINRVEGIARTKLSFPPISFDFSNEYEKTIEQFEKEFIDDSIISAQDYLLRLTGRNFTFFRLNFVAMDRENWNLFKDARKFVNNYVLTLDSFIQQRLDMKVAQNMF
jgi:hypothetical protein